MIWIKKIDHSREALIELSKICFDKKVYKELGYPVFSDKNHTWYLAYLGQELIGFCASVDKKEYISFNHDYILPSERGNGYYKELFYKRYFDNRSREIRATATNKSLKTFLEFRFDIERKTTNYTFLKLNKQ